MMGAANPFLKACWRGQAALLFITPWTLASVVKSPEVLQSLWSWQNQGLLLATSLAQSFYASLLVLSLNYTGMGTAFLLSNCHSLLIATWRLLTGQQLTLTESIGVFVGFSGAIVTSLDKADSGEAHFGNLLLSWLRWSATTNEFGIPDNILGAAIAFLSGICGALYISIAAKIRSQLEFSAFMWGLVAYASVAQALCAVAVAPATGAPVSSVLSLNFNPVTGIFGWLSKEQIWPVLLVSVAGTLFGQCMYVAVMRYLDTIAVSVAMLCEPVVSVAIGVALGQGGWPGALGWSGSVVSIVGAVVVVVGGSRKTTSTTVH
mmetsp:Transcript_25882/g.72491  ORF Transcript_25882/g.72491 Transcript_25882/m.72491 type:complete len:319 (+) Transcript_25882:1859-2815(+)